MSRLKMILIIFVLALSVPAKALQQFEIKIKNHLFFPSVLTVKAHEKIKLLIINDDDSAEEFESYELNREKIIAGKSKTIIFINPLPPGEYPFFGEFYPKTAQGKIIAR